MPKAKTKEFIFSKNMLKKMGRRIKPNLLVLGASGGLANAFLHSLVHHRNLFNRLVLLDKNKKLISNPYVDHKNLEYVFLNKEIKLPSGKKEYRSILKKYRINIVVDLTDADSIPLIEASNEAGVDYINTAINGNKKTLSNLISEIFSKKHKWNGARNILCAGMNPGNVNMFVRYGIEKFGVPEEIVHFEYDTSMIARRWKAMITWSIHEFLIENVYDPGGIALGKDKVKLLLPNALSNTEDMRSVLKPILKLNEYPHGALVLHEENLTLSRKYNIPSKFLYAVHMKTMDALSKIYKQEKDVNQQQLDAADNLINILDGSENIGVLLRYKNKKAYYLNTVPNISIMGTNATYLQASIGIFAALFVLLVDKLKKGTYFVEDLYDTHYKYYMFDNLRVQEFVFTQDKLNGYNPQVRLRRKNRFEHLYF